MSRGAPTPAIADAARTRALIQTTWRILMTRIRRRRALCHRQL
jgi:hypothetical protein